jgi:endoglycosylceramidase
VARTGYPGHVTTRLLPLLLLLGCAPTELAPVRVDGQRILDERGRDLLLRGINARVEGLFDVTFDDGRTALQPIPPFGPDDCRFLAEQAGMNLLRLPVNWSGVEAVQGTYDEAYRDRVVELVAGCAEHGVYTLVDLHQDAYSKHIGEDGAPLWAIVPPPTELLEGPLTDLAERRTSAQVLAAFGSFFDNEQGLQDDFAAMVAWLAEGLLGTPGLVGVELFNEPVVFDDAALAAFHERVAAAVRAVDADLPIAFEPDALRNFTDEDPVAFPATWTAPIYAPHHYTDVFEDGWASEDTDDIRDGVDNLALEALRHGAPAIVGEFGNDPRTDRGALWLRTTYEAFDEHRLSAALWLYEEWSQDSWGLWDEAPGPSRGTLRTVAMDLVARPYPAAVSGELTEFDWDGSTLTVAFAGGGEHVLAAPQHLGSEVPAATCGGAAVDAARYGGFVTVSCDDSPLTLSF